MGKRKEYIEVDCPACNCGLSIDLESLDVIAFGDQATKVNKPKKSGSGSDSEIENNESDTETAEPEDRGSDTEQEMSETQQERENDSENTEQDAETSKETGSDVKDEQKPKRWLK